MRGRRVRPPIEFEVAGDLGWWTARIPGRVQARGEALAGPTASGSAGSGRAGPASTSPSTGPGRKPHDRQHPAAAGAGSQPRRWERGLLAALAGLPAGLARHRAMAGARHARRVLTGHATGGMRGGAPVALGLFLLTWVVMMAAMMLPAAPPVVLAVGRWARRSGRSRLAAVGFIAGYLADWAVAGLGAHAVVAGLEHRYPSPGPAAVRAGAVMPAAAGLWQLTPLKHACLRQCQSPLAFLAASAARLTRGRLGTVQAGIRHGGSCRAPSQPRAAEIGGH